MKNKSRFAAIIHTLALPLVCALVLLPCGSCSKAGRYHNREKGFSVLSPEKWEIRENYMGTSVILISPSDEKNDIFRENLNIVVEDITAGTDLSRYLEYSLHNMARVLQGFSGGRIELRRLNRYEAGRVAYSYTLGTLHLESTVTVLMSKQKAYVITCTSLKKDAALYREIFERTVGSFRFE